MNKFVQLWLIGLSAIAFTACGSSSNKDDGITEVTYEELLNTGVDGYKINVDIDDGGEVDSGVTYYFCTGALGPDDEDYAAVTGDLTGDEPDYDHGYLSDVDEYLEFDSRNEGMEDPDGYSIISLDRILQEGETYDIEVWGVMLMEPVTVHINSISAFDCSTVPEPVVMK